MTDMLLGCLCVIGIFTLSRHIYKTWPLPIFNPLLISIVSIATLLSTLSIGYSAFFVTIQPIHFMLEIAVVALAYPLYVQFHAIKRYSLLIVLCSFIGVSSATIIAFLLSWLFSLNAPVSASLAALSVTTPITILISHSLGGMSALAAIMVILVGVFGGMFGITLLNACKVHSPQAKGIALGVSCHAIGTASALEHHPSAGAFASAAMTISTITTALWVPILYTWLDTFR